MASDQVTIVLGILAVTGPLVVTGLNQWNQAKREKAVRANELEQEKLRQAHELRRDRQAKYYEFNLQEYREYHEACMSLLAATHIFVTTAGARHKAFEAMKKPRTSQTLGAASAESEIASASAERAQQHADRALLVLRADEDAATVMELYQTLPARELLDNPEDA